MVTILSGAVTRAQCTMCSVCDGGCADDCAECAADGSDLTVRTARADAWRKSREAALELAYGAELPRGFRGEVMFRQTRHFEFTFAPARLDGCPESDRHRQLHLYADRLESLHAAFVSTLAIEDGEMFTPVRDARTSADPQRFADDPGSSRIAILIIADESVLRRLCPRETGIVAQGLGAKRFGASASLVLLHDTRAIDGDAGMFRLLAHEVTHLLLSRLEPVTWIGERGFGWLDAGLAHYIEATAVDGRCGAMCHHEHPQRPVDFHRGDWSSAARTLDARGELPSVHELMDVDTTDLRPEQHVAAFAFVTWLATKTSGKLGAIARRAGRSDASGSDVLESALEQKLADIETDWREWLRSEESR